jgi:hypothetical protein
MNIFNLMIKHLTLVIIVLSLVSCSSQNRHEMLLTKYQIEQLDSLLKVNKFDDNAFKERGLIPSGRQLSNQMNSLLNECLEEIIEKSQNGSKPIAVSRYLNKGLKRFGKFAYDTEEKEFIADEFYKLSEILDIDFNENIDKWVYGRLLYGVLNHLDNKDYAVQDTIIKLCTNCKDTLSLGIISYREGIAENWSIVKCKKCGTANAIKIPANVYEFSFINCLGNNEITPVYDSIAADSVIKKMNPE